MCFRSFGRCVSTKIVGNCWSIPISQFSIHVFFRIQRSFCYIRHFFVKRENVNKLTRGSSNYMWFDHGGLESVTKSDIFVSKFLFESKIRLFGHTILPIYYNTINPEKTICGREKWKKVSRIFWTAPDCSNTTSLSSYSLINNLFSCSKKCYFTFVHHTVALNISENNYLACQPLRTTVLNHFY
jgi:hypothetical protein